MTTQERLTRIHNRLTCYEIAAIQGDRRVLIAYSQARSRHGLLRACQKRGEAIVRALGLKDSDLLMPAPRAVEGFNLGPWQVRFTGRTERDAILEGELPYIGEMPEATA